MMAKSLGIIKFPTRCKQAGKEYVRNPSNPRHSQFSRSEKKITPSTLCKIDTIPHISSSPSNRVRYLRIVHAGRPASEDFNDRKSHIFPSGWDRMGWRVIPCHGVLGSCCAVLFLFENALNPVLCSRFSMGGWVCVWWCFLEWVFRFGV